MPPLSAYTSFESLLFFQSLATSDSRPTSFGSISTLLRNNRLVRDHVEFDADRLAPEALEDLYATLMRDGFTRDGLASDGQSSEVSTPNPRKRKISSPRPDETITHATLVPELVAHLYARYKEMVTREIRDDEKKYSEIRAELEELQRQDKPTEAATISKTKKPGAPPSEKMDVDVKEETPSQNIPPVGGKPLEETVPQMRDKPKPEQQPQHIEVKAPALPQPAPPVAPSLAPQAQLATYKTQEEAREGTRPQLVNIQPAGEPTIQPLVSSAQKVLPATPAPTRIAPSHPSQIAPRAHPIPPLSSVTTPTGLVLPTTQRTPAQPTFQQWQLDPSPHSPYPAISPGTATSQTTQTSVKRPLPPSTATPLVPPSQPPLQHHATHTPGAVSSAVQTPVPTRRSISQTPSAAFPSFSESRASHPRLSIDTQGSSTPWKRTPRLSIPRSPTSPPRPRPEDVSPISEKGSPIDGMDMSPPPRKSSDERKTRRSQPDKKSTSTVKTEKLAGRRIRAVSSASSRSRGRSVASRDESTAPSEDTLRASGRRKAALASADEENFKGRSKRKRGASDVILDTEPHPADIPKFDTTKYVMATRQFPRTAAPIMNDVETHKLASIFGKPIGERDAPGYHDLIYRPQDLKTIKSAIYQGNKAVATAGESFSTPGDGESPAPGTPSKTGVLMLQKTEDFIPPKAIVNSAQLEKELIRMFANAIMFNPIPQRGFGPAFPMTSDRGSRESTQVGDGDEGGIIQDSLEMFEDVQQAVTRWRAAERTADELASKHVLSLRRGSASDFNTDSADDAKG